MRGDQTNEFFKIFGYKKSLMLCIAFVTTNSLNFTAKICSFDYENRTNVLFIMTQTQYTLLR